MVKSYQELADEVDASFDGLVEYLDDLEVAVEKKNIEAEMAAEDKVLEYWARYKKALGAAREHSDHTWMRERGSDGL